MNIGPLTIEIGRQEPEVVPEPHENPLTADELLEMAKSVEGILDTAKKLFGEFSMPGTEADVAKLMREAHAAKAAEDAGRAAVESEVVVDSED